MDKKRKGRIKCCLKTCKSMSQDTIQNVKFYRVLAALKHRAIQRDKWIEWIRKINGKDWQPTQNHRICSRHFIGNESSPTSTSPNYVPSIQFRSNDCDETKEKAIIECFQRNIHQRIHMHSLSKKRANNSKKNCSNNELQSKVDKEVQVHIYSINYQHPLGDDSKLFLCHQITHNNQCDVQLQVFIPEETKSLRIIENNTTNTCTNNIQNKNVVTESNNLNIGTTNVSKCPGGFHGYSSITNDEEMLDFCGVTQAIFDLLLQILNDKEGLKMENKNQLMMFLVKLKTGLPFSGIAIFFGVQKSTVSQSFFSLLQTLRVSCNNFIFWPCRDVVQETMPDAFKQSCHNCRVIIDYINIEVDKTSFMEPPIDFDYNKEYILKALVGCTPSGAVSIISKCYDEHVTDCQMIDNSGMLDLLENGDTILADERFAGVQATLDKNNKNVIVITPPLVPNDGLPNENIDEANNLRIQITNIIQRLKTYQILDRFSECLLSYADDILFMCAVLVNLQPTIKNSSNSTEKN